MKATAKHDCSITLTTDLNQLSFNRQRVVKGQVIELPVFKDEKLKPPISDTLGERCVVFKDEIMLMPTYSRDFDYQQ